ELGEPFLQREYVVAVQWRGHQEGQWPAAEPITGATELSIRLLTHDAVDEQPTLLLESTYRMFHRVVERVVAGVAVGGVKQPQPVQQGLDFGDVVSGVAAAEYPHALLAFLWHRVNKLDAV